MQKYIEYKWTYDITPSSALSLSFSLISALQNFCGTDSS